jgi:hypothetical protein
LSKPREFVPPYKAHPGQVTFHQDPHRFRVLNCGRRWGKTKCSIFELWSILQKAPEKFPIGWVVAPNYPLVVIDWDEALEIMGPAVLNRNVQEHWLEVALGNNRKAKVEFKSAEKDDQGLRGRGLSGLLVDEAAMVSQKAWEYGLRPALGDKMGKCIIISTPKGRNFFYDLYMMGQETSTTYDPDWKSWTFPTNSNPYYPVSEWEKNKLVTPEIVWKQEYMADFIQEAGEVFHSLAKLSHCGLSPRQAGRQYVIAVDLARTVDWTVILVMDDLGRVVYANRSKELSWSVQVKLIQSVHEAYKPARIVLDSSGVGDVIEDNVRKAGMPTEGVKTGSVNIKGELIEGLQVAIEQGHISLPSELKWLWDELRQYTYKELDSGHIRYEAPSGKHDDGVIALALAVYAFKGQLGKQRTEQAPPAEYTTQEEYARLTDPKNSRIKSRWGKAVMPYIKLKVLR